MKFYIKAFCLSIFVIGCFQPIQAQQAPEYTQYMYNTMSLNPGYTGSTDDLEATLLYRSQWVGLDGAPKTANFGILSPISSNKMGLGLNIVNDRIGPSNETLITANYAYNLTLGEQTTLGLGLNAGAKILDIDWSKGRIMDSNDPIYAQNINNELKPVIGAGAYLFGEKYYLGLSVPNFLRADYYDDIQQSRIVDKLHYYMLAGYVFDLSSNLKFKPSVMLKAVQGAPLAYDLSANFLISEKFTLGAAYRWDDSVSGLVGFQVSNTIFIGYSYDYTVSDLTRYNNGSHEFILRFKAFTKSSTLKSPRFF